jgi:hypothetical protein
MSQYFYDGQIKKYLTQFMRLMSHFHYKDAKGQLVQVPVRYGDANRQAAAIVNKNSENVVQSAPFIACYIKDLKFDRNRMQEPTFVDKVHVRERALNEAGTEYLNVQGANYTIERMMPTPYMITFNADIWTSNFDQKLQLWEQITVLFNPSMELQTTDNYLDWTSLSVLELTDGCVFESRAIPQGMSNDISIATLQFTAPAWISPPAKVKKLGIVTKIINNVFANPAGTGEEGGYDDIPQGGDVFGGLTPDAQVVVTPGDFELLVLNNTAVLVPPGYSNVSDGWIDLDQVPNRPSWLSLLDQYPGSFRAGLSQLRLTKPNGSEIVAYISLNPTNESLMVLNIDADTIPANTLITGRGTIDAIINPHTFNPLTPVANTRYLILEDIDVLGANAWKNSDNSDFEANANDIIEWDGSAWAVIFDSQNTGTVTYITNSYTGIQYKWDGVQWIKSFEGIYSNLDWRLVL